MIDMIETIREEEELKLEEMKSAFESSREETKNKNVEDLESMKHDLIKKIEDLDKEFEVSFNKFVADTETKATSYDDLLKDNQTSSDAINRYQRQINRLKEQTAFFTLKIQQNKNDCENRNLRLKREKDKIVEHYHGLKHTMSVSREKEEKRLGDLTMNSKECMDTLKGYQKLGEKILKTAELCRKLETEKEKVLPFYQSDEVTQDELPDIKVEKIEGMKKQKYNEFQLLDNFYKRYNKVLLDKLAIEKQKATLEKENMFFKSLLKQYLDGVSVNDDVLNSNNPLLVINSKVNLNRPPVERMDGQPHKTFVEGNTVINNIAMQKNANYN